MTRDEILAMARQAGFHCYNGCVDGIDIDALRFAALVAAAEREACAKTVEAESCGGSAFNSAAQYMAKAIRSRGEKGQS